MNNKHCLLALNRMPMVGPRTIKRLIQRWPTLNDLFLLSVDDRIEAGLPRRLAEAISSYDARGVDADLRWQEGELCTLLTWDDLDYPALLKEIYDPPPVLYAEGDLSSLKQPAIGMVGTRNPSLIGRDTAWQFAHELVGHGFCIVSGLARGIDACSHSGSLAANGRTIAVMGTGIDCIYPRAHAKLASTIARQGLLLSEFPLKSAPKAGHFPRRNRIISGLSLSILVVEAAVKSGSLITARYALEQNRDVLAIPGSIYNAQATGCHYLLQQGATLITSVRDVLNAMNRDWLRSGVYETVLPSLNKDGLIMHFMDNEVLTVDQLAVKSGLSIDQTLCELSELELAGMVRAMLGGYMRCMQ